jgi:hypothetical protein
VEHGDELGVAGALVHQVGEREVHGEAPRRDWDSPREPRPGMTVKWPGTGLAS